jgi:hypothetical protein
MKRHWQAGVVLTLLFALAAALLFLWSNTAMRKAWLIPTHYLAQLAFFLFVCSLTRGLSSLLAGMAGVSLFALVHASANFYLDWLGAPIDWKGVDGTVSVMGIQAIFSTYLLLMAFGGVHIARYVRHKLKRNHSNR